LTSINAFKPGAGKTKAHRALESAPTALMQRHGAMITIQSRLHVPNMHGKEVVSFLLNCTDEQYRAWWPGTHLQLHAVARQPGDIGNIYYMDEFVGEYRIRMTGAVRALAPAGKIVWQFKKGIALPVWLTLDLVDDVEGVAITHTIEAGFRGPGRLIDPLLRLYFSDQFEQAMDEHVRTEFPKLRDLLRSADNKAPQ
jgi:hypothetical protein